MSNAISAGIPLDPNALLAYADETQLDEAKDDKKLRKAQESAAFKNQIDSAQKSVDHNRKSSDERLQAQKDKTSGSFWGFIAAIAIAIVAAIVSIASMGALAGPAIMAGAALIGVALAGGPAIGAMAAEGNEEAANVAQEKADAEKVLEKEFEKSVKDYGDDVEKADDLLEQILQSKRNRNDDYRNVNLAG